MDLPKNIAKVVKRVPHPLQTKTFIFDMERVVEGEADEVVNAFCSSNDTVSIVLDRHKEKLIYRVIFKEHGKE